jgi:hypothetical protein
MKKGFLLERDLVASAEAEAVEEVLGLEPGKLSAAEKVEFLAVVAIAASFSSTDPSTGEAIVISPSRIAAIPAISQRHCYQVEAARGVLTPEQVVEAWQANTPDYRDGRHPDLLFDIAQYNFGHDGPVDEVVRGLTLAEQRRQELVERLRSEVRTAGRQYMWNRPLDDDTEEELIDSVIEAL